MVFLFLIFQSSFLFVFLMLDSNCSFSVQDVHVEDNDVYLAFANSSFHPILGNQLMLLIHCFLFMWESINFFLYVYFQLMFIFCKKLLLKIKLIWHLSIPLLLLMIVHELLFVVSIMVLKSKVFTIVNLASRLKVFTMMMLFKRRLWCKLKIQVNPMLMLMITFLIKCLI